MRIAATHGILTAVSYSSVPPELSQRFAWGCLTLVLLLLVWCLCRSETVRRGLFGLEDPRTFAALRIGFALFTLINFVNLAPYWQMLWSDEGLFDLAYAQDHMGRTALRGWTPEDGFFDGFAVLNFLWHKPSLFYMFGAPDHVLVHMGVFLAALVLYGLGFWTRVTGVLAWLLMSSVYNRNALYWEGTDVVYRSFFFILLFARTGHAWSIDNWWRCRRLKARGRLEDPSVGRGDPRDIAKAPGAGWSGAYRGGEPVYRLVPSWPRILFMLQLAAIYTTTGLEKTGEVWARGDALYFALNMDHFYRFEGWTQIVSAALGTNVFRVMTWITLWWERCFPIVLLGCILGFAHRSRDEPWFVAERASAWRRWLARLAILLAYATLYRLNVEAFPYCLEKPDDARVAAGLRNLHVVYGMVIPSFVVAWWVLRRWPLRVPLGRWLTGVRSELVVSHETLRATFLGRRTWLTLGLAFHGFLALFMNIGMFPFIMMLTYWGFVRGDETRDAAARMVAWARRVPAALPPPSTFVERMASVAFALRELLRRSVRVVLPASAERWLAPAAPAASVRVPGARVPNSLVLIELLAAAALLIALVRKEAWLEKATWWWLGVMFVVALLARMRPPALLDQPHMVGRGPALAYGAVGRLFVLGFMLWHASAVALHLMPSYNPFNTWRTPLRRVHGSWLSATGTSQSWKMFAPNPPRANVFMKTVVIEQDGERWDLRNNAFSYRPDPWIINDRMRKMQRRMIDKGSWYQRHWAGFQCREWFWRTGELPAEIEISKLVTRIPTPEMVATKGRYAPALLPVRETVEKTFKCKPDDLTAEFKRRHGFEPSAMELQREQREHERRAKSWASRRVAWDKRRDWGGGEPQASASAEDVD